ncbi:regulator of telomere elongation helicase 1, partial [Carica papaya]|uniref:regulator of telomere elongation helicase 1 n=1 Tax=Carica papaya TaxID=3649 RepID=UPI000B8D0C64
CAYPAALLLKLEKRIAEVSVESKELGFTRPGPYIYELLAELNITHETAPKLIDIIEEAMVVLEEDKMQKMESTTSRLENIGDILKIIFKDKGNGHAEFYRVHVQEIEANAADVLRGKPSRTLSWWCFNPGIAMQEFSRMGVGSIIVTSGTLSPMDYFAQELKIDFPIRLENPHVISSNQIWAGVVPVGPSGCAFNSSYRNRDSLEYKQELGNAIVNFARIIPDGLLVFFPSYYLLDQCIRCWKNVSHGNLTTIWERICKHKKPVIEPRQSSLFASSSGEYMSKLKDKSTSGAVFFAVCRGKVSEGLDFADHAGRAVVIIGIPFAMRNDPKVRLKREYLDQQMQQRSEECKTPKSHVLTGEEWYNQQASRAVNQAVGRVIRHSHDYGAIIFCDERFLQPNHQSQVSHWIQPYVKCYSKLEMWFY